MSDTTVTLRRKIQSSEDLGSVVRTMKAVAASGIGQYEASVRALSGYYESIEMGLGVCLRDSAPGISPVPESRHTPVADAIVFGSDQGLVGQFNDLVTTYAVQNLAELPGEYRVWAVGERVKARLLSSGIPVHASFDLPASVTGIVPLVGEILVETEKMNQSREPAELHLFYNRPEANAEYSPVTQCLLPLDQKWLHGLTRRPWPSGMLPQVFGDTTRTLRALINEYLFVSLFRACAESLASENASRLAAMQRADKNIEELLSTFNTTYHRLRKNSIDAELFDVISAYDSLGGEIR